ncbi:MAG: hypothetical protein ACI8PZ_002025 [Myxococcota bacterium]
MSHPHLTAEKLQQISLTRDELSHLATCRTCARERDRLTFPFNAVTEHQDGRSSDDATPAVPPPRAVTPWPEQIGPWRPTGVLGRGGMGVVYRATHAETGATAAVKTLELVDVFRVRSLRREIAALEAVEHPCVVRILDSGVHDGRQWYAMELVEGLPLDRVLPDRNTALRALARVCRTLAWLHGEGLVHLDLKPANILLAEGGRPVLVDFGLVARTRDPDGQARLEHSDPRAGTAKYISPERIQGHAVDARADMYAVGCMVYEALTGESPLSRSAFDTLNAHMRDAPWPPSWLTDVPPELELLVLRLLAKTPARRPGYAADVADAIDAVLGPDPLAVALPAPRPWVYRPPLVGREPDRAWLRDTLAEHRVVLVTGPHGIGKTRLVAELLGDSAGRATFVATCPTADPPPLVGLLPVLEAAVDRALADDLAVPGASALAALVPDLLRLPGVTADDTPPPTDVVIAHVFAAVELALDGANGLLAIDDVHCADALTRAVLERLVQSGDAPALQVVATWPAERDQPTLQAMVDRLALPVHDLGRLDAEAIRALASGMLAATSIDPAVSDLLHERSGGNPRFAEELLRATVADGRLVRDMWGRWSIRADALAATAFPASLDAVLELRLGALSPAARDLAARASVLVGPFPDDLLAALGPTDALPELRARHVLEEVTEGWRFPHDALRNAAGHGLDAATRAAHHRAAATHLDARSPSRRATLLPVIARHWAGAGDSERGRLTAVEAGIAARSQDRLPAAGELCRWAVERESGLPDVAGWRARMIIACADYVAGAEAAGVSDRLGQVRRSALRANAWALAGEALLAELWVLRSRWDADRAPALLDAAAELEPRLDTATRATLWHDLGGVHLRRAQLDAAREALGRSLSLARESRNRRTELRAFESQANLAFREGRLVDALALHGEVVAGWQARDNPIMVAVSRSNQAIPLRVTGRSDLALAANEQAERTLSRVGHELYALHTLRQQVEDLLQLGRHADAWDRVTALLARPAMAKAPQRGGTLAQSARAAGGLGDLDAVADRVARALDADPSARVRVQLLRVQRVALGDLDAASAAWGELAYLADTSPRLAVNLLAACAQEAIASGADPEPWIARARAQAADSLAGGASAEYLWLAGAERSVAALRSGAPVVRGTALVEVPLPLRVQLYRQGVLPEAWVYA